MSGNANSVSLRLLKKHPSFIDGFSGLIDMSKTSSRYNQHETGREADTSSLQSDWNAIGLDLWHSIQAYDEEQETDGGRE